jgi:hypothetical protein
MLGRMLLGITIGLGVGFVLLTLKGLWQWQGGWCWAMAAPLLLVVGAIANIVVAIWLDPTAHNLWPLELLVWLALALVAVAMLYLLRWLRRRIGNHTVPEKTKGTI